MPLKDLEYKMTEESLTIFEELSKKLFGTDIILLLLSIGQIKGKIDDSLMKKILEQM